MIKIVEVIRKKVKNSLVRLVVEVLKDDTQEHTVFSLPNYESIPVDGLKVLLLPTVKNGRSVCIGVPLETDIEQGETKIKGTDTNGNEKCSIYLKSDGTIEAGESGHKFLVMENFFDIFNNHTHAVEGSATLLPNQQATTVHKTSSLKGS